MKWRIWGGRKKQPKSKKRSLGGVLCLFGIFLKLSTVFGAVWGHRGRLLSPASTRAEWEMLCLTDQSCLEANLSSPGKKKKNPPSSLTWKTRIKMKAHSGNTAWGASEVITFLKKSLTVWKYGWEYGRLKWELCREDAMSVTYSSATCMFL